MGTGIFEADIYCRNCRRIFSANLMEISEDHPAVCPHCHNNIAEQYRESAEMNPGCLDEVLSHIRNMVRDN